MTFEEKDCQSYRTKEMMWVKLISVGEEVQKYVETVFSCAAVTNFSKYTDIRIELVWKK